MTQTAQIVQAAELPAIERTWLDSNGDPIDLTGYTLTLRIGTTPPILKTAGVIGDANGLVTISWTAGELDAVVPGPYSCQVWARRTADSLDRVMPLGLRLLPAVPLPV